MKVGDAMQLACAWCKRIIRPGNTEHVSHGCCPACYERLLKEIRA